MTVVLIGNAKSGRGRARQLFGRFRTALEAAGYRVVPLALGDPGFAGLDVFESQRFRGASAIVACGGDGTVNAVAGVAARTGTPIYHVPSGNENLFARAFRMNRRPVTLIHALKTRRVIWTDAGRAGGRRFLIMASVGPDAGVVRSLHHARTRALGHLAYAEPIARELRRPTLPRLSVELDGEDVVRDRAGWLVVANNPEYASRMNPASRASVSDGLLDMVFMPAGNLRDCINWVARAWTRQLIRDPRLIYRTGRRITIRSDAPLVHQVDGEFFPEVNGDHSLSVSVEPHSLPVLTP